MKFDWFLFGLILVIALLSLVIIFSIDSLLFKSQLFFLLTGLLFFYLFFKIDIAVLKSFALPFFVLSLVFLVLTFIFGAAARGSVRWIRIGFLNFQPSEIAKPFLIIFFADLASRLDLAKFKNVFLFSLVLVLPLFLIFKQPDLGSSLVVLFIFFAIAAAAGIKKIYSVVGVLTLSLAVPLVWQFLKPYQKQRIFTFLNPDFDPLGSGYHILQSVITIGSGQFAGKGLGLGTQSQLEFLPERHTDFIFASFAEELGFLGASFLMVFYFLLLWRILVIAQGAKTKFAGLLCIGVFAMIFGQLTINIGMNLGVLPVTGVTLPLFSAGGSSLTATLICLGIVENISSQIDSKKMIEIG
jgi:rod shape determining protein RodA